MTHIAGLTERYRVMSSITHQDTQVDLLLALNISDLLAVFVYPLPLKCGSPTTAVLYSKWRSNFNLRIYNISQTMIMYTDRHFLYYAETVAQARLHEYYPGSNQQLRFHDSSSVGSSAVSSAVSDSIHYRWRRLRIDAVHNVLNLRRNFVTFLLRQANQWMNDVSFPPRTQQKTT